MRNMNARMRRMSYRQQQAGRGKNDPQADGSTPLAATSGDGGSSGRSDGPDRAPDPDPTPSDGPSGSSDTDGGSSSWARPRAAATPVVAATAVEAAGATDPRAGQTAGPVRASEAATKWATNARIVSVWKTSWKPNQRGEKSGRLMP